MELRIQPKAKRRSQAEIRSAERACQDIGVHWVELAGLLLAGIGAGMVGYAAGLASLISYPALLAVGLPPITANVTNSIALSGSSVGGLLSSGPELRPQAHRIAPFAAAGLIGGVVGALLLLKAPPDTFEQIVPWLVAFGSIALIARPWLRRLRIDRISERHPVIVIVITIIAIYAGYFGAGAGVLLVAAFGAVVVDRYVIINALKSIVMAGANLGSLIVFVVATPVEWAAVIPMAIGAVIGSSIAPPILRRLPETPLRIGVAIAGLVLAVKLYLG